MTITNPPICSDFIMNLQLPPEQSVEITSYCGSLMHMPLSAAIVGFGLDTNKQRAMQLQDYLRSYHVRHVMPALAVETQVLNWLTTVVTPPVPLPSLWKAMAVKYLIGWVKRGMSLIDVETEPNQAKYLMLAGWTKEQAEMVSQDEYGPPSPLVVQPTALEDPFAAGGKAGSPEDVMDGFNVPSYYRDCQIPKRVLPRDRAGQPSDVHHTTLVAAGKPDYNHAAHAVAADDAFCGGDYDDEEISPLAAVQPMFADIEPMFLD